MSEFVNFYSQAVKKLNNSPLTKGERQKQSAQGKIIRCRFCLSEAHIHERSGMVHCEKCGNSFSAAPGTKYSIDLDSVQKMSGKQLYDAAFYNGKVLVPFLELSAKKQYIEALLLMAGYWEGKSNKSNAEAYYKAASEQSPEGKAAYILYQFWQEPAYPEYPDLLFELHKCLQEPFYFIDPNECRDVFDEREEMYIQYCMDESAKRVQQRIEELDRLFWERSHPFAEKDEYVDDDFYQNYYLPYLNGQKTDDGADWNGMPWTADHANAAGV